MDIESLKKTEGFLTGVIKLVDKAPQFDHLEETRDLLLTLILGQGQVVYECGHHSTPKDCARATLLEYNEFLTDCGPGDVEAATERFLDKVGIFRECHV